MRRFRRFRAVMIFARQVARVWFWCVAAQAHLGIVEGVALGELRQPDCLQQRQRRLVILQQPPTTNTDTHQPQMLPALHDSAASSKPRESSESLRAVAHEVEGVGCGRSVGVGELLAQCSVREVSLLRDE